MKRTTLSFCFSSRSIWLLLHSFCSRPQKRWTVYRGESTYRHISSFSFFFPFSLLLLNYLKRVCGLFWYSRGTRYSSISSLSLMQSVYFLLVSRHQKSALILVQFSQQSLKNFSVISLRSAREGNFLETLQFSYSSRMDIWLRSSEISLLENSPVSASVVILEFLVREVNLFLMRSRQAGVFCSVLGLGLGLRCCRLSTYRLNCSFSCLRALFCSLRRSSSDLGYGGGCLGRTRREERRVAMRMGRQSILDSPILNQWGLSPNLSPCMEDDRFINLI